MEFRHSLAAACDDWLLIQMYQLNARSNNPKMNAYFYELFMKTITYVLIQNPVFYDFCFSFLFRLHRLMLIDFGVGANSTNITLDEFIFRKRISTNIPISRLNLLTLVDCLYCKNQI